LINLSRLAKKFLDLRGQRSSVSQTVLALWLAGSIVA